MPAHLAVLRGGVGTLVRGLVESVSAAVSAPDELVVLTGPSGRVSRAAMRRLRGPAGGLARLAYEQGVAAHLARRADLVHLVDARPLLASRTPFVLTVHDVSYLDHPEWFPRIARAYKGAMLSRAMAQRPAAIVCDSEHARRQLLAHHPEAGDLDVRVVYPGVTASPPAPPRGNPWPRDRPYFLTVSVVEPRKNHLALLAAYRLARRSGLKLDWKVVGEPGHLAGPILASLRSEPGVQVLGRVSPDRLEELYRGAQFVATPSHAEGFGFPPLEAMARGVPTITSRGSAFDETVADASLRVASDDIQGWSEAVLRLASDSGERQRLEAAGRQRAEMFDWGRTAASIVALYRQVAG